MALGVAWGSHVGGGAEGPQYVALCTWTTISVQVLTGKDRPVTPGPAQGERGATRLIGVWVGGTVGEWVGR